VKWTVKWNDFLKRFGEESDLPPIAKNIFLELGFTSDSSDENTLFLEKANYNREKFLKVLAIISVAHHGDRGGEFGHLVGEEFGKLPLKDQSDGLDIAILELHIWKESRKSEFGL
jgi:hypothetical protein